MFGKKEKKQIRVRECVEKCIIIRGASVQAGLKLMFLFTHIFIHEVVLHTVFLILSKISLIFLDKASQRKEI